MCLFDFYFSYCVALVPIEKVVYCRLFVNQVGNSGQDRLSRLHRSLKGGWCVKHYDFEIKFSNSEQMSGSSQKAKFLLQSFVAL